MPLRGNTQYKNFESGNNDNGVNEVILISVVQNICVNKALHLYYIFDVSWMEPILK